MLRVIIFMFSMIAGIISTTYIAWLGVDMWNWYMVPLLNTPPTTVATIFGAIMIASLLKAILTTSKVKDWNDDDDLIEQFSQLVANVFLNMVTATIVYGVVYFHHSWFM